MGRIVDEIRPTRASPVAEVGRAPNNTTRAPDSIPKSRTRRDEPYLQSGLHIASRPHPIPGPFEIPNTSSRPRHAVPLALRRRRLLAGGRRPPTEAIQTPLLRGPLPSPLPASAASVSGALTRATATAASPFSFSSPEPPLLQAMAVQQALPAAPRDTRAARAFYYYYYYPAAAGTGGGGGGAAAGGIPAQGEGLRREPSAVGQEGGDRRVLPPVWAPGEGRARARPRRSRAQRGLLLPLLRRRRRGRRGGACGGGWRGWLPWEVAHREAWRRQEREGQGWAAGALGERRPEARATVAVARGQGRGVPWVPQGGGITARQLAGRRLCIREDTQGVASHLKIYFLLFPVNNRTSIAYYVFFWNQTNCIVIGVHVCVFKNAKQVKFFYK